MMLPINLRTPVYDGGIFGISFFNGRLLSGEDMAAEQSANRQGRRLLGKALGEGVAYGLEVMRMEGARDTDPFVTIEPGLAINGEGQTLLLENRVHISLHHLETIIDTSFTGFAVCDDERTPFRTDSSFTQTGDGIYVLTISSAEVSVGRAPVSGLGNIDAGCNARYNVEGLMFKLLPLGVAQADYSPLYKLRNRVAWQCLRTADRVRDPFGVIGQPQGLLDTLRTVADTDKRLKACDVPLAAVYLESSGRIRFIDIWSVRRRLTPSAQGGFWSALAAGRTLTAVESSFLQSQARWAALTAERVLAEGEARYLQFEAHISELVSLQQQEAFAGQPSAPNQIAAAQRFEFLPAAGILPITGTGSADGFNWRVFFGDHAPDRLDMTDSTMVASLLRESFGHQPIQVGNTANGKLHLYLVRENVDAVGRGESAQLVLVFAQRTLNYIGVARFDYARSGVGAYR